MKKITFLLLFCTFFILNGYSQTKQESIKLLFKVTEQDSLMDKMLSSIIPMMNNQMQSMIKDSTSRVRSEERMASFMQVMKGITSRMLNDDMVALYDKYFTQSEINEFIAFYKTPAGRKFTKVTPEIQKELMVIVMQKYMPEIKKSMMENVETKK
jgi:uncharacterized protein